MKRERGPSTLTLDCEICGEPMQVDRQRYVELVRAGRRPRCRKNGCERLCGREKPGAARVAEPLATVEVPPHVVVWPRRKRGNANGALAKLVVERCGDWRYEDAAGPSAGGGV